MALLALWSVLAVSSAAAVAEEYFTDWEIERIRDAQGLERRVPTLLAIAQDRLIQLGLAEGEVSEKDSTGPGKAVTFLVGILQPNVAAEMERAAEAAREAGKFEHDLSAFSHAGLLAGYSQALNEAMDAIDDAYERRSEDLRASLETLRDYTEGTMPLLMDFQPQDPEEQAAVRKAIDEAETARSGAVRALEMIPKTEQDR